MIFGLETVYPFSYRRLATKSNENLKSSAVVHSPPTDFRKLVPDWACPESVVKLADEVFTPKDEAVPMRCIAGPTVPLMRTSAILITASSVLLFVLTYYHSECMMTGSVTYPAWLFAVVVPFVICNMFIEVACLRYSIVPFIQVIGHFHHSVFKVGFYSWTIPWLCVSLVMLADSVTDNFFGAVTMLTNHCQVKRSVTPDIKELWAATIQQSMIKWAAHVDFRLIIFFVWFLGLFKQMYALLETMPQKSEMNQTDYKVGEHVRSEWHNICGHKVTSGDVLHTLAEPCCMGTIKRQSLTYPMAKERQLRKNGDPVHTPFCVGRSLFFVRVVCARSLNSILFAGILVSGLHVNVQVTLLAMAHASEGIHHNKFTANQATLSIVLSLMTSSIRLADVISVLRFSAEVRMAIKSAILDYDMHLSDEEEQLLSSVRGYTRTLWICVLLFLATFAYAICKLIMVYNCQDSLWNITGCVDLKELKMRLQT